MRQFWIIPEQDENVRSLKAYYDAQLAFARKVVEILEGIPESTFAIGSQRSPQTTQPRRVWTRSSDEHSTNTDDRCSTPTSPISKRHQFDRSSTISDFSTTSPIATGHARKESAGGVLSNGHALSPVLSTRKKHQKQVRALYNFEATAAGELSLQKGDVIRIIEEIDEGWWEGEMVDSKGVRHEGMFPSNYVEEVNTTDAAPERRQGSISSNNSDPKYADEDEATYYARESEPTISYDDVGADPEPEAPLLASPARRTTFPLTRQSTNGSAPSSPSPARAPLSRPPSGILSKPVGTRAAPPPPASRRTGTDSMRHSAIFNHASEGFSPPAVSTPTSGYISMDYFASQSADSAKGPCRECQCTEFSPNVFKRGSCNNCFHPHS